MQIKFLITILSVSFLFSKSILSNSNKMNFSIMFVSGHSSNIDLSNIVLSIFEQKLAYKESNEKKYNVTVSFETNAGEQIQCNGSAIPLQNDELPSKENLNGFIDTLEGFEQLKYTHYKNIHLLSKLKLNSLLIDIDDNNSQCKDISFLLAETLRELRGNIPKIPYQSILLKKENVGAIAMNVLITKLD